MGFWKGLINDAQKDVNPAHVIALALTFASICWVSYLVYKNLTLPDLSGIAYLLGGSGAMNVANKAEEIVAKFKRPADSPQAKQP